MASIRDQLRCCLWFPRTNEDTNNTHTHTRSKTKTDEALSESTQKQRPTVSANPHPPMEDKRVRQAKLSLVQQTQTKLHIRGITSLKRDYIVVPRKLSFKQAIYYMCWASDTLDTKRFKFRARRVLDALSSGQISKAGPCPPFEIKSINLQKWILAIIKADLLHSQTKKTNTKTLYKHTTYKHMNRVREIHSTDIKGKATTKTLRSNTRSYMVFHQTFSLDPHWFFFHSRIGSGHVIIWKNGGRQT